MNDAGFTCNVCSHVMTFFPAVYDPRENPTCEFCHSSVRMRGIVHHLSVGLFGDSKCLSEFPHSPHIVGLGLSDWEGYGNVLPYKFRYTNTFFHRKPFLDITNPDISHFNSCDFLISTEVFEHIPPPVNRAFQGAFNLLKPSGLLVLTVPFTDVPRTIEHFPELDLFRVIDLDGEYALVNKSIDGRFTLHTDLSFHGGPGSTLEMRIFSRSDVVHHLEQAGFVDVQIQGEAVPKWGILPPHPWGLPITARKR